MRRKILIASPVQESVLTQFEGVYEVTYRPTVDRETLLSIIPEFEAVLVATNPKFDSAVIQRASSLKIVVRLGIGVDHIDLEQCKKRGITVAITPNANIAPVTEMVISRLIYAIRHFDVARENQFAGSFRSNLIIGRELSSLTVGVIGTGRVGSRLIRMLSYLGVQNIIAYDPYISSNIKSSIPASYVDDLSKMLPHCDVVSLHVPLTYETRGMVDESFLDNMKDNSILVNTSRGQVAPMQLLLDYSKRGRIARFILDVYDNEPYTPRKEDYSTLDQFFDLSPHIGAYTETSLLARSQEAFIQLRDFFEGNVPHGIVDLVKGY